MSRTSCGPESLSPSMTRPYATPPEIEGRRRMDDRREACVHHRIISGLAPCGEVIDLDVCQSYRRELRPAQCFGRCRN